MVAYVILCIIFFIIGLFMTITGIIYRKKIPSEWTFFLIAFGIFIILALGAVNLALAAIINRT
ncbi:hypothetical protein [Clostridium oryzae]|uniref:Uncharacterized protein n=1 Tax=Clostridium oryzae TaxID=1450648 RepID=A0A1V4IUX1_9CLOT|nr:hypothetical protein [Clostridium oryzae]OPJ63832.1 hypothetical protein CLORY_10160 [Clostridium oryzae]